MKKKIYYVFSDDWGSFISTDLNDSGDEYSLCGEFSNLKEAKKYAIKRLKGKVVCYEDDIGQIKESMKDIRKTTVDDF